MKSLKMNLTKSTRRLPSGGCPTCYCNLCGEFSAIFNKDSGNPYYFRNDETRAPYTTAEMSCSFSNLSVWDCIWYNGAISNIKIGKVKINYTDGTSETIDASKVISMKN